jgi:DNA repair exonuclease SbcCD nuclease subunit
MANGVKFIHAADLHLDSPFKGLPDLPDPLFEAIRNSTFHALNHLVDAVIEENVDFLLITGDLFDHEKQSLKAQIRLREAFERLEQYQIPVYLSYGNHDYINGNIHQVTYPDNVHIFPDEEVRSFPYEKDGKILAEIYGFSYVNRAVTTNKAKEYRVRNREVPYHIAMLHGSVQGSTGHEPYAPFQLSDLSSEPFHYWALGHIHQRQVLKNDPAIVYPGNIQGRHRKETGEKGCYLVSLKDNQTELRFIPLQAILFNNLSIDVTHCKDIFQVEKAILHEVKNRDIEQEQLLDLTLTSSVDILQTWFVQGTLDEIIEIVNEALTKEKPWSYIFRTSINVKADIAPEDNHFGEHFLGELKKNFREDAEMEMLAELYQHRKARKYLDLPASSDLEEWKEEARSRLFTDMLKGGT